ncbi:MAG: hypothetical protein JWN78_691 [Bacteroidota bacterium]|nr:hypothetical protein [Bacteroidota bacterium]
MQLPIEKAFRILRVNFRKHGLKITEDVFFRFHPSTEKRPPEICVFCGSTSNLTREHVIPRWVYERNTNLEFISSTNRQSQTYNKAVVPACAKCNNSVLAQIEKEIKFVITKDTFSKQHEEHSAANIMRWLELLDYKGQVYDCRRSYIKYSNGKYNPLWGALPLAMMRHFWEMKPFKPFDYLRNTQRRITVKEKLTRINSFVVFRPKESHFNFFVQPNEYIYISFSSIKLAFFYFFKEDFENYYDAGKKAVYIIKRVAET